MYPFPLSVAWAGSGFSLLPAGARWDVPCAFVGHRYIVCWSVRGGCKGGGGGWFMVVVRTYLNNVRLASSSHCGLCTLIFFTGTRDPLMHRCVAHTNVIAILLLTYQHVFE